MFSCHLLRFFCWPPNSMEVCWRCRASKGTDDVAMSYTNTASDAPWLLTEYVDVPWCVQPTLSLLPGFSIKMLGLDLLHIFHLGVGRDLVGSSMRVLCTTMIFGGGNLDQKLQKASGWLRAWSKQNRLSLAIKKLTKANLNWKSNEYPEVHCKGYDCFVILKWLVSGPLKCERASEIADNVATALWAADSLMSLLMNAGRFLTAHEQQHREVVGLLFIRTYMRLASEALSNRVRLWRVRPKFHLLHHVVLDKRLQNPHITSTWMDEDAVKKFMLVKKKTHRRRATERLLGRWLLSLKNKLVELCVHMEKNSGHYRVGWSVLGHHFNQKNLGPHVSNIL